MVYLLFFPKTIGRKNVKVKGKAIVISNHKSMADPFLVSMTFHRHIKWMGKVELFKNAILREFFKAIGTFPINRGENDLGAIRRAFKTLRDGEVLGIFPEGTRVKEEGIREFETGTALLALKTQAPVIPVYLGGNYKIFRRMTITVGEPIMISELFANETKAQAINLATIYLRNKLNELKEQTTKP